MIYTTSTASTTKTYVVNLEEQNKETGEYGWICPICGRGVAPNVKVCPCKSEPTYVPYPIYPWIYPSYPEWWKKITITCKPNTTDASKTAYTPSNIYTTTTSTNGDK